MVACSRGAWRACRSRCDVDLGGRTAPGRCSPARELDAFCSGHATGADGNAVAATASLPTSLVRPSFSANIPDNCDVAARTANGDVPGAEPVQRATDPQLRATAGSAPGPASGAGSDCFESRRPTAGPIPIKLLAKSVPRDRSTDSVHGSAADRSPASRFSDRLRLPNEIKQPPLSRRSNHKSLKPAAPSPDICGTGPDSARGRTRPRSDCRRPRVDLLPRSLSIRVETLNDDPDKRKKERESDLKWKGIFTIDSETLRTAKGRPCRNMKCDVDKFERGTDLMIKDWINQMETYFTVCQVPAEAFIGSMLMKIAPDT